ncbi:O-antigen ligase domain-containing protein [Elizabethkingia miricola]|uniref:O-antigen ligase family protein n=1 Tax=Elizabethkingia bruuniana TaxID=1756149 RepID=UPI0009990644|nr:O-antigen ligase family protein [Elizabethkingia bruuniana]OPC58308.1 hypothetical protein BAY07_04280 [Elizabethkingia bruuniana]OPC62257.1 hypothetical protein BAY13_05385 [Elizabethkingia bruuniana]RBI92033.1 O-antigen ligase domain-containing protein [Elizabethkingia miricola]
MFRKINITDLLLILIVVVFSDDTLLFGSNSNPIMSGIKYAVYLLLILVRLFFIKKSINTRAFLRGTKIFFIIATIIFFSSLIHNDFRVGNLLLLFTIFTSIIYVQTINFQRFVSIYVKILYFLAVSSLIVYAINIFLPSIISLFPVVTNFADVEFRTLLVSNVFNGFNQFRNTGIYREPGVFAIYLLIALLFTLFITNKIDKKKIIVLSITLFTTLSTAGIFLLFLIFLMYFLTKRNMKNVLIMIFSGISIYTIFLFFPSLYDMVFSKLNSDNKDYLSSITRLASFLTPLEIIKNYPIFGVGLTDFVLYYEKFSYKTVGISLKADASATNTFLNFTAVFGIFFGGLILYYYFQLSRYIVGKYAIFLVIIFFIMFSSQELKYSILFNTLMIYGAFYNKKKV